MAGLADLFALQGWSGGHAPELPEIPRVYQDLPEDQRAATRRQNILGLGGLIGQSGGVQNGQHQQSLGAALLQAAQLSQQNRQAALEEEQRRAHHEAQGQRQQQMEELRYAQQAEKLNADRQKRIQEMRERDREMMEERRQRSAVEGMYEEVVQGIPEDDPLRVSAEVARQKGDMSTLAQLNNQAAVNRAWRERGIDPNDPLGQARAEKEQALQLQAQYGRGPAPAKLQRFEQNGQMFTFDPSTGTATPMEGVPQETQQGRLDPIRKAALQQTQREHELAMEMGRPYSFDQELAKNLSRLRTYYDSGSRPEVDQELLSAGVQRSASGRVRVVEQAPSPYLENPAGAPTSSVGAPTERRAAPAPATGIETNNEELRSITGRLVASGASEARLRSAVQTLRSQGLTDEEIARQLTQAYGTSAPSSASSARRRQRHQRGQMNNG